MSETKDIPVPDIGDFDQVEVIEVLVSPGDTISAEDSLITLESDKASMEIPAPFGGTVKEVRVEVGSKVAQGEVICTVEPTEADSSTEEAPKTASGNDKSADTGSGPPSPDDRSEGPAAEQTSDDHARAPVDPEPARPPEEDTSPPVPGPRPSPTAHIQHESHVKAHASPGVRRFARELGVDLGQVAGSGRKKRILRADVTAHVKKVMSQPAATSSGLGVASMPEIDFSQFGETETVELSRINKLTGRSLHRNWVTVPHVTQFDKADITDLEHFRKELNEEQKGEVKITLVAFLTKALVSALREFPRFNSSLDPTGEKLIFKKYFHIGIAVDTKDGLVVPVIRDVDRKSLTDVARELADMSQAARDKKLSREQMQGGCISISSLGGVGGTAFTPIVNAPEVAILGASRAATQPVWDGEQFAPRLMLPLSLSYDHRVIDGADATRFTDYIGRLLS
ncbi:MAG: dihydrolipoyllysine-residue acetyltransferase, partial [Halofilum sp. (in: g-proteobacteria)]